MKLLAHLFHQSSIGTHIQNAIEIDIYLFHSSGLISKSCVFWAWQLLALRSPLRVCLRQKLSPEKLGRKALNRKAHHLSWKALLPEQAPTVPLFRPRSLHVEKLSPGGLPSWPPLFGWLLLVAVLLAHRRPSCWSTRVSHVYAHMCAHAFPRTAALLRTEKRACELRSKLLRSSARFSFHSFLDHLR